MADRVVFVGCRAFIGVQFGSEVPGNVGGCEGEVGTEQDASFWAKALRLGNAVGLDASAVSK